MSKAFVSLVFVGALVAIASANPYFAHNTPCPHKTCNKLQPLVPVERLPVPTVPVQVEVVNTSPSYRPASFLELVEIVLDCFNTLRIPLHRFPSYLTGIFPDDPETKCFLRCMAIKLGVYCDETGADLDRHCLQFGLGECCDNFVNRHLTCLQQNSGPCPDRCTAAYKQELCFQEPIAKYLDYHFQQLVGLLHQAKCSHNLPMLHP
ncbi:uncharacterized protein LOC131284194 [Anopheles ziemanni]|uniref:uncharacterized protein LOC131271804 n=1 Tax=Anopheles coustani TaxID=139045 RepID=UPI002659D2C5|nr:uncharacterized protein LOC131271804 [Anopheles coustani]XP_058169031.1 uncharacterized protein LOC131284194 [Anopheles ziemanni]